MFTRKMNRKAFTLVELIIVIAIIAILSVSAFMVLTKWIGESRDSRRLSDIGTIQRALSTYQSDYKENPNGTLSTGGNLTGYNFSGSANSGTIVWEGPFDKAFMDNLGGFDVLQKVVKDPSSDETDQYYQISIDNETKKKFTVSATLENGDNNPTAELRGNFSAGSTGYYNGSGVSLPSLGLPENHNEPIENAGTFLTGGQSGNDKQSLPYTIGQ